MEEINLSLVRWFSGGKERKDNASELIQNLIFDLKKNSDTKQLEQLLISYRRELDEEKSSVPFILSRLNISISKVLSENDIVLTKSQKEMLKKLRALSHIRYGY
ncbi:bacteriocin immunity protein [Streptococcus hyovaginalis]|uniref:bacteriocin immunity protein n=1 Tax=Streptococcus hyovaginalis TaxID=149015 RepID=UPI0020168861|nr:bacteriocin immunity protein [Streptococcus hyovaginalis]